MPHARTFQSVDSIILDVTMLYIVAAVVLLPTLGVGGASADFLKPVIKIHDSKAIGAELCNQQLQLLMGKGEKKKK